ncbi:cell division cycle 25 [Perkinsus olseni]|uniref:protein-tyrosine-phosphatase n=1 Tax=Perkinsus olseni TaxID=32597 RepID=A0A7J6P0I5_PEROL|nr:cell division cycle 25 [Perkinsus olseni]
MSACDPLSPDQCNGRGVCDPGFDDIPSSCDCTVWWDGEQCQRISGYYWLVITLIIVAVLKLTFFVFYCWFKYRRVAGYSRSQRVVRSPAYVQPVTKGAVRSQPPAGAQYGSYTGKASYTESMLRYVSTDTVAELVRSNQVRNEDAIYLIDCRYPYEYNGGHIMSAINFPPYELDSLKEFVFNDLASRDRRRAIIILHCEFSQLRAPVATDALKKHSARYGCSRPLELYVMKGGYCDFFRKFKELCEPQSYTEMQGTMENNDSSNNADDLPALLPGGLRGSPPAHMRGRQRRRRKVRGRCFDDMDLSFRGEGSSCGRRYRSVLAFQTPAGGEGMTGELSPELCARLLSDELIWVRPSIHGRESAVAGWCPEDVCRNHASAAAAPTAFTSTGFGYGTGRPSVSSVSMDGTCVSDDDDDWRGG